MGKYKISLFVILFFLSLSVCNYANIPNFERESILGGFYPVIPINSTGYTVLFMGGLSTRESKLDWYKQIINNNIDNINISIIVELSELPFFAPKNKVKSKVKEWCYSLGMEPKYVYNIFYEWSTEIKDAFQTNIKMVSLVILKNDETYSIIEGKYTPQKMAQLKNILQNKVR
ncbi:MAG: hypothetical protein ACK5KT_16210 [Dysgonomonas sp.]